MLAKIKAWIAAAFSAAEHFFADYINAAFPVVKQEAMHILLPLADQVIATLENSGLKGDEKRAQAFSQISTSLTQMGKDLGPALINVAIELAVQKLQNAPAPGNEGNFAGGDSAAPAV